MDHLISFQTNEEKKAFLLSINVCWVTVLTWATAINSIYSNTDDTLYTKRVFHSFVSFLHFLYFCFYRIFPNKSVARYVSTPFKTHELKYETKTISRMLFIVFLFLLFQRPLNLIQLLYWNELCASDLVFAFNFNLRNEEKNRILLLLLFLFTFAFIDWCMERNEKQIFYVFIVEHTFAVVGKLKPGTEIICF